VKINLCFRMVIIEADETVKINFNILKVKQIIWKWLYLHSPIFHGLSDSSTNFDFISKTLRPWNKRRPFTFEKASKYSFVWKIQMEFTSSQTHLDLKVLFCRRPRRTIFYLIYLYIKNIKMKWSQQLKATLFDM